MVRYEIFPYWRVNDALTTLSAAADEPEASRDVGEFRGFSDVPPGSAAEGRIEFADERGLSGPILWYGGRWQFMDLCPEWGCVAVEYSAAGDVVHAYPLRPGELQRAAEASFADGADGAEHPYEFAPDFSFQRDLSLRSASRYGNGDLLLSFQYRDNAFPYGAGVARIDRDGRPVWFRHDYSHHWAYLDDEGIALVPGLAIGGADITIDAGRWSHTLDCGTDRPYEDTISVVGEDGRLVKRINLLDALAESPYAHALLGTVDVGSHTSYSHNRCDPLHLNYVHRLGADAGGAWGIAPGDFVASLRNLSAFAIVDPETGAVKRLVKGTFYQQHAVRHLEGSVFIMFDNIGGGADGGHPRLLMIDIADGRETTVFPNERTPEDLLSRLYSRNRGSVSVSPDGRRAIAAYTLKGIAVEVRLSDGEVLNVFRSLHDASGLGQFPEGRADSAALFRMYGIDYAR